MGTLFRGSLALSRLRQARRVDSGKPQAFRQGVTVLGGVAHTPLSRSPGGCRQALPREGWQGVGASASPAMEVHPQGDAPRWPKARETVHDQGSGSCLPVRVMNQGGVGPGSESFFAAEVGRDRPQNPPPLTQISRGDRRPWVAVYHQDGNVLSVTVMRAMCSACDAGCRGDRLQRVAVYHRSTVPVLGWKSCRVCRLHSGV